MLKYIVTYLFNIKYSLRIMKIITYSIKFRVRQSILFLLIIPILIKTGCQL